MMEVGVVGFENSSYLCKTFPLEEDIDSILLRNAIGARVRICA